MGRVARRRARIAARKLLSRARASARSRLKLPKPRVRALTVVFAGGTTIASGAALVYLPAGVILAGVGLVTFGLVFMDVDERPRR